MDSEESCTPINGRMDVTGVIPFETEENCKEMNYQSCKMGWCSLHSLYYPLRVLKSDLGFSPLGYACAQNSQPNYVATYKMVKEECAKIRGVRAGARCEFDICNIETTGTPLIMSRQCPHGTKFAHLSVDASETECSLLGVSSTNKNDCRVELCDMRKGRVPCLYYITNKVNRPT